MARARFAVKLLVALGCVELVGLWAFALGLLPGGSPQRTPRVHLRVMSPRADLLLSAPSPNTQSMSFWGPTGRSTLHLYETPTLASQPAELVADGRGGYWFTEQGSDKLGHVSQGGRFREYSVPTMHSQPFALALDGSRSVWFTELAVGKLGRIDAGGHVTEFSLRSRTAQPYALAPGSSGRMWFTEYGANAVGYVDSHGGITEYRLPTQGASPAGIAFGADRNMWVTESGYGASKLAKVTSEGVVTEYQLPTAGAQPFGIAPSGRGLWITEFGSGKIASADFSGHFTEYPVPTRGATPFHLIVTPDGQVWFTESSTGHIGRLSFKRGREYIVEYLLPAQAAALDVAPGPHGTIWTTEFMLDSLGVFTP